jgi:hypothetical protein
MRKIKGAGWLIMAGLLATALVAPAAVFAADLKDVHQNTPWNAEGFEDECDVELEPGEVLWHFIQNQVEGAESGTITAEFASGTVVQANDTSSSTNLHFTLITGRTTLIDASTDVAAGNLVLSHICVGPDEATPTPEQSVEGETDEITEPPTDTLVGSTGSPSNGAWTILLVALAGLMVSALVLTPSARKNRR